MEEKKMTIAELAAASGKSKTAVYNLAKKLGRLPTLEEVQSVKRGAPVKYK